MNKQIETGLDVSDQLAAQEEYDAEQERIVKAKKLSTTVPKRYAREYEIMLRIKTTFEAQLHKAIAAKENPEDVNIGLVEVSVPRWDEKQVRWFAPSMKSTKGYYFTVDINVQYRRLSSWRSEPTGKLRIVAGSYGNRTNYPERKDGSFDYESIAAHILARLREQRRAQVLQAAEADNTDEAEELQEALGVASWDSTFQIKPSADAARPILLSVNIKRNLTDEQVRVLHKALVEAGILEAKKES